MKAVLMVDAHFLFMQERHAGVRVDYKALMDYVKTLAPELGAARVFLVDYGSGRSQQGFLGKLSKLGFLATVVKGKHYSERARGTPIPALADSMVNSVWDGKAQNIYLVAAHGDLSWAAETCRAHGAKVHLVTFMNVAAQVLLDAVDFHKPIPDSCLTYPGQE